MPLTTNARYTRVAIVLHWTIAACILFNLVSGHVMESLSRGEAKHIWVSIHASSGLSVLMLSLCRIAWRLTHRPPPFDAALSRAERMMAEAVHGVLYLMMIAMPLTGWVISSASTRKVAGAALFLVTPLPKLSFLEKLPITQKVAAHDQAVSLHAIGGWLMIALLAAHIAGALKHQLLERRPQFARMWFSPKGTA